MPSWVDSRVPAPRDISTDPLAAAVIADAALRCDQIAPRSRPDSPVPVALGADELLPFARQVLCDLTSLLGAEDSEVRSRLAQLVADRLVADRAERSMAEWRAWVWREFEQAGLDPYAAPAPGPAWPDPDARLAAAPATASPADGRQAERPADLPCNASLAAAAPARQARPPAAAAVLPHRAG